jgi:hypothetical protein
MYMDTDVYIDTDMDTVTTDMYMEIGHSIDIFLIFLNEYQIYIRGTLSVRYRDGAIVETVQQQ